MPLTDDVVACARRYAAGEIGLEDVDEFLALHAQEIASLRANDPARRLAGLIEVSLSELDHGHIDTAEVERRVSEFLRGDQTKQDQRQARTGRIQAS
jgi:hypothetical protein